MMDDEVERPIAYASHSLAKVAMWSSKQDNGSVQKRVSKYFFTYRNAPQATTGETPAKPFMGQKLDLIRLTTTCKRQTTFNASE